MLRTFIVIIFIFNLSGCGYNDIQTYDEQVNASWSVFVFNYNESQITDAAVNLFIQI